MQTGATLLANNTQQCWELLALVASVCMGLNITDKATATKQLMVTKHGAAAKQGMVTKQSAYGYQVGMVTK